MYTLNTNTFTVVHVDTHLEDLLQFVHDLYRLYVIKPRAEISDRAAAEDNTTQSLVLNYINTRMIKSCTEALRQLFEAG